MRIRCSLLLLAMVGAVVGGCEVAPEPVVLGPADGHDLPGIDLERIKVGEAAPDFSLLSFRGDTVTLSQYQGERNIILVFYRGAW